MAWPLARKQSFPRSPSTKAEDHQATEEKDGSQRSVVLFLATKSSEVTVDAVAHHLRNDLFATYGQVISLARRGLLDLRWSGAQVMVRLTLEGQRLAESARRVD